MAANHITSPANPLLKEIRKAQQRGGLTAQGWMIAEGPHLVEEVARSGLIAACVVVTQGLSLPPGLRADRVFEVPARVFQSISGTETPQGMLALLEPPHATLPEILSARALAVVLDGVRDPGNLGAIARSAEAFAATGLVILDGSANPWSPKALRASAGSLLRIPVIRAPRDTFALPIPLFAGRGDRGDAPWTCDFSGPCAIVVGNEGQGVSDPILRLARPVRIPTRGVESLNAAVAASLLLYEAARQRA